VLKRGKIAIIVSVVISVIVIGLITKSFADEKPNVVVVFKDFNSQYWEILKAGTEKGFRDFGINGKVVAPLEGTVEEQVDLLEDVLKEKPDVLIVSPIIPNEVAPILEKFVQNNIPVLLLDTDYSWEHKTSYIGTNNLELGKKAGALVSSQLQPGDKVALIGGDMRVPVVSERIQGAKITLKAAGLKIATEKIGLSDDSETVKKAMESIIKDHPDVKGIVAANDGMALNALEVIEKHGLEMPVTGADGIIEMLKLIDEGTLTGTVAQNPYDMGYLSVETALKVSQGEKVEKTVDSGVDIITKSNAQKRLDFYYDKVLK
jgi:ribose transport system substrate-binding protein